MTVVTVTARGSHDPRIHRVGPGFKAACSCGWGSDFITNDRNIAMKWSVVHADPQGNGRVKVELGC